MRSIDVNFPSFCGNHVILNVPFKDKEVWLECTSQRLPFGYLGDFTDNREVLLVTPKGGNVVTTMSYPDSTNITKVKATFTVLPTTNLQGEIQIDSRGLNYEKRFGLNIMNADKQTVFYKTHWPELTRFKINNLTFTDNAKEAIFIENLEFNNDSFARLSGSNIVLRLNPLAANDLVPARYKERTKPFEILRGSVHESEYYIKLPEGFLLESLPQTIAIISDFGQYDLSFERTQDNKIRLNRRLFLKSGFYVKEQYNDYRDFMRSVQRADKTSVILKGQ
jgi:hypothetical protein